MSRRTTARTPVASAPRPPVRRERRRPAQAPHRHETAWESFAVGLRRIPRTAWVCAAVAVLNAACWSVVSPPFQVTDESSHYAYVARLAETGTLPSSPAENYPPAESRALNDLHTTAVAERPTFHTIASESEQRQLEQDLAQPGGLSGSPGAGVAQAQPPLYYALETIPYGLAAGGTVLDRLQAMRLLSALMGGLTALFAYLFLREALPAEPWAWTVGGLGVAAMPLLGVMSGAVNPDALLFAVSAALFYCLARAFRRGIDRRLAIALGATLAIGCLTKLTFLCLVPGALLGVAVACVRAARAGRVGDAREADVSPGDRGRVSPGLGRRTAVVAFAIAVGPLVLYALLGAALGRSVGGYLTSFLHSGADLREWSYVWQLYLPRLPGMTADFHGFLTARGYWFDDLVGNYGWLDTRFPSWVYSFALIPMAAIVALFVRALVLSRRALRGRLVEGVVYGAMCLGVMYVVGVQDYRSNLPGEYVEPRYLLPLLVLWGAVLTLAARGAGRRWGPAAGALIVTVALAHNLFSQLLVISRYYG